MGRKKSPDRPFPRITLKETIKVGHYIKELNGGNPWPPEDIANAIGIGAKTNKFYYYTASSRDFGITEGTSRKENISITNFGRELLYAPDPKTEHQKKIEAFLRIPIFKKVFEHYKGGNLPEMKYLGNTLENEFGLDTRVHEEFSKLFKENVKFLNLKDGYTENGATSSISEEEGSTRVVGEPKKGSKGLKAFVIMPFIEKNPNRPTGFFNEVLESLIIPASLEIGFSVETANRKGSDVIQSTIINELLKADLVIADLTDHNPNVLFELGLRIAEDKPIALIKSDDTGRIFDVDNMLRVFEYNSNLWKSTIEDDLPNLQDHIEASWDNKDSEFSFMKILTRNNLNV